MTAFQTAVKLWKMQPPGFQKRVLAASKRSGLPYFVWYMAHFDEKHSAENYAGNLPAVKDRYFRCEGDQRPACERQFEKIMDCLVLKNGVTKTTYAGRHRQLLRRVLSDPRAALDRPSIAVLDVPSSAGMSSLDTYALLSERCTVARYVLGDLYFNIHVDRERQCVFDEEGHLLQVRTNQGFVSVHRPFVMGNEQSSLVRFLMSSLDRRTARVARTIPLAGGSRLHPGAVAASRGGARCRRRPAAGAHVRRISCQLKSQFDLILSFNLLAEELLSIRADRAGR